MADILVVTGTGTGVGKTCVAAGIARAAVRLGRRVGVVKAAATGVPPHDDAELLRAAAGCDAPLDDVCPVRLRAPLAPAVAADLEGVAVDPESVRAAIRRMSDGRDLVIVEGAGGLLVPIAWGWTIADLASACGAPLVVVGRLGLGTIHDTTATVESARARGLRVAAVVLLPESDAPQGDAERTNPASVARAAGVAPPSVMPRLSPSDAGDPDRLADAVSAALDVPAILAAARAAPAPTAATDALRRADLAHVWHPFTQMQEWTDPLVIERAEGPHVFDTDGRRYVDGTSSLWVTTLGHREPAIDAAVREQLGRVAHSTLLGLANVPSIRLAEMLVRRAPPGLTRVFYSDDGSTAAEAAMKMAFLHQQRRGEARRTKFVFFRGSYHGDTLGSVSVGGIDLFHRLFRPLLFDSLRAAAPPCIRCRRSGARPDCDACGGVDAAELLRTRGGEVAAVVIEPVVHGAAGMVVQPEGWLRRIADAARDAGALVIADEVATGVGRTGRFFAVEHEGVRPDLLCVAKGLSGGYLPVAATLATEDVYASFLGRFDEYRTFFHGHTYTGNPLACAAAVANLGEMDRRGVVADVERKGALLEAALAPLLRRRCVAEIRRKGLMLGVDLVRDRGTLEPLPPSLRAGHRVCMETRRRGVILRPLGDVVVVMPPLATPDDVLREIAAALSAAVDAVLPEETP
ncbi:MAG: Adenosylmethionine-8-amino-7-oxononanoate aminotransferase [Planctomycetes bacterium]|nr:Adenosylmethionine-8-amino-7-oxononanoate aminotransferase [Planctomycetota bacterium]